MTILLARHEALERIKRFAPDVANDIDILLAHCTGHDVAWLLAHGDAELTKEQADLFCSLIERRRRHEPVAYLTGWQPFYGRRFFVDKHVLIPRPESELMIDTLIHDFTGRTNLDIIDVGTGSGCLGITAALHFSAGRVTAIDSSPEALAVAERNAQALNVSNISFLNGDLLQPLIVSGIKADAILANLPYLSPSDIAASPTRDDLSFEPRQALLADEDGFALMKSCAKQALDVLRNGGRLYLEMMPRQTQPFLSWLKQSHLPYTNAVKNDLSGHERLVILTKSC
jgi:release factor glutamine methyltransferase